MFGSMTRVSAHQPGSSEGSEPQRAGWGWGRYGGQLEPWRVFDPFKATLTIWRMRSVEVGIRALSCHADLGGC